MATRNTGSAVVFGDLVTAVSTDQKYPLGTLRDQEGECYRYVQRNDATVDFAAGDLVYRGPTVSSAGMWVVSGDISDEDSALAVGIAMGAIANSGYGWIKTKGYYSGAKKLAGTALKSWREGDFLVAAHSSTSDGKIKNGRETAASTKVSRAELARALERIVGWAAATATKSATSGALWIDME